MSGENGTEAATLEPRYSDVEPWLRGVHSFVATSLMVVSVLGNALVVWVVARNKELQYRSILASMGAVVVNILFSLVATPQVLAGSVTGEWPFTQKGCVAIGFIAISIFHVRWMNALLIAIDRLLYIITPFFYQRNTKRILGVLTAVVWTLPFLINAPSIVRGTYRYRSSFTFCTIECSDDEVCVYSYTLIFTGYLIIGMLCPTAIYIFLYCFGKKKRRDMHREMGTQTHVDPPSASNGHPSSDPHLSATRLSCDLFNISEEGETMVMADLSPPNPPSSQGEETLTQEPGKIRTPKTNCTHNGGTHLNASSPHTVSSELNTHTPVKSRTAHTDSHQDTDEEEREDTKQAMLPLPQQRVSIETATSPSHPRRPSLMNLSRLTLAAMVPGRQQVAVALQERRAMITFAIIFTNLVVTQIPLFFLSTTRRASFYRSIPIWVHLIGVNLYFLAPALEAIIIMRNRDFKNVLSRIFRRRHYFSFSNSGMR